MTEAGKIAGPDARKTICTFWSVHGYLSMNVFVSARALCGTRIRRCASGDYSGAIRKMARISCFKSNIIQA